MSEKFKNCVKKLRRNLTSQECIDILKKHIDELNRIPLADLYELFDVLDEDVLVELVEDGLDINRLSRKVAIPNRTLIEMAISDEDLDMVELLVENGADVNIRDGSPLVKAIEMDNIRFVKYLLSVGADPNIQDYDGNTALHIAVIDDNIKIIKLLLQYGADSDIQNKRGETPYDIANEEIRALFDESLLHA